MSQPLVQAARYDVDVKTANPNPKATITLTGHSVGRSRHSCWGSNDPRSR